jgi:hypothetical protein
MKRRMKMPSPALAVSIIALFVALGGTTYAAVSLPANSVGTKQLKNSAVTGTKIKNGSVTTPKISKGTIAALQAAGAGSVLTFDAPATASPSMTTLGTALGVTWGAECVLSSGHANLQFFVKTTTGAWTWDLGQETSLSSAYSFHLVAPAGTLSSFTSFGAADGATAPNDYEVDDQGLQLAPVPGYLELHLTVLDTTAPSHACHMSVYAVPAKGAVKSARHMLRRSGSSLPPLAGPR